ncbi:glycosyltransferase [Azospirillum sp. RWY-5-1]|uniref:Glycosyltransferase n=1 Tax=Azospirillum oleiclasticum TaxID=2735135 RepID=A0ABX2TMJ8_9PROT|nr:glycosyltransferase [Azospirillum oleiclasticum]NYZ24638.1 glycosyltransferase [Azospirillum oleiclasticum]
MDLSVVLYHPDGRVLAEALASITAAAAVLRAATGWDTALWLVDNAETGGEEPGGEEQGEEARLRGIVAESGVAAAMPVTLLSGHGNVGYGAGHNRAIRQGRGAFHLVLNHDILLDPQALLEGFHFMKSNPGVVLLSPRVSNEAGGQEFICKRTPTLLDLGLRGFAPGFLKRRFAGRLARYEMRDLTGEEPVHGVEYAGGAFMLFRRDALETLGGFDERFFLYFEDFDLSKRAAALGTVAYVPAVRIVHYGGKAARKGWLHIRLFAASALRYFAKHGWRLA